MDYDDYLNTTELVTVSPPSSMLGPITLPVKLGEHCSVLVGDYVYVIGGKVTSNKNFSKKVLSINIHDGKMMYLADMKETRFKHGCAPFTNGNKRFIAVAGGFTYKNIDDPSNKNEACQYKTEFLDIDENIWHRGRYDNVELLQEQIKIQNHLFQLQVQIYQDIVRMVLKWLPLLKEMVPFCLELVVIYMNTIYIPLTAYFFN